MKIASWNINSVRARIDNLKEWLDENEPDILFLQEIKCQDDQFPYDDIKAMGYTAQVKGQKAYNGVATLTRFDDLTVSSDMLDGDSEDDHARFIECEYKGVRFINIYLPNGNGGDEKYAFKMGWMDRLYDHLKSHLANEQPFVLGGDFNVIPQNEDCYSPAAWKDDALFVQPTRHQYYRLLNLGLVDAFRHFNTDPGQYTFWDYQAGRWPKDEGIRIDHFLTSPEMSDKLKNCLIDKTPRGKEKASDHTPIVLELDL